MSNRCRIANFCITREPLSKSVKHFWKCWVISEIRNTFGSILYLKNVGNGPIFWKQRRRSLEIVMLNSYPLSILGKSDRFRLYLCACPFLCLSACVCVCVCYNRSHRSYLSEKKCKNVCAAVLNAPEQWFAWLKSTKM